MNKCNALGGLCSPFCNKEASWDFCNGVVHYMICDDHKGTYEKMFSRAKFIYIEESKQ